MEYIDSIEFHLQIKIVSILEYTQPHKTPTIYSGDYYYKIECVDRNFANWIINLNL